VSITMRGPVTVATRARSRRSVSRALLHLGGLRRAEQVVLEDDATGLQATVGL
jgi:hypothetical protein